LLPKWTLGSGGIRVGVAIYSGHLLMDTISAAYATIARCMKSTKMKRRP
jgi:hypothetical protein